jgi:predicted RNase H-like HicB family nuclease
MSETLVQSGGGRINRAAASDVLWSNEVEISGFLEGPAVSVETIEGLPARLVKAYAELATRHAIVRRVDPGVWVASVAGLEGAYADAETPEAAMQSLPEVIIDWVAVKRRMGAEIPSVDGLDLNLRD